MPLLQIHDFGTFWLPQVSRFMDALTAQDYIIYAGKNYDHESLDYDPLQEVGFLDFLLKGHEAYLFFRGPDTRMLPAATRPPSRRHMFVGFNFRTRPGRCIINEYTTGDDFLCKLVELHTANFTKPASPRPIASRVDFPIRIMPNQQYPRIIEGAFGMRYVENETADYSIYRRPLFAHDTDFDAAGQYICGGGGLAGGMTGITGTTGET